MSDRIVIKEVAPRDGLQAQPQHLTIEQRLELIAILSASGISECEIGSFVSPSAVPQMAGTDVIASNLPDSDVVYSALVPNSKGYDLALRAGVKQLAIVVSATEQMNKKNINMTLSETFAMAEDLMSRAKNDGVDIHAYLAVAFECPYEGRVAMETVLRQADSLMRCQPARLVVADTIGAANPRAVKEMMDALVQDFGAARLGCHFHDTRAMAIANVFAAIESGVRYFDSSAGGLGGCPFAPGAKGNVATEDLVLLAHSMGLETGIRLDALLEGIDVMNTMLSADNGGRAHYWLKNNWQKIAGALQ